MHTIVLSDNAGETELFACEELQKYVHLSTGAVLPVKRESEFTCAEDNYAVYLGDTSTGRGFSTRVSQIENDGYSIFPDGENLILYAATERGALYAVYRYLSEGFGIKFLNIREEYVPERAYSLPMPTISVNPAFKFSGNLTDVTYHTDGGKYSDDMPAYYAKICATHEFIYLNKTTDTGKTEDFFRALDRVGGGIEMDVSINPTHNNLVYVDPSVYFTDERKEQNRHMFCFGSSRTFDANGPVSDINYADGIKADGTIDRSTVNAASVYLEALKRQILNNPSCKYYNCGQMDITYCHPDCGTTDTETSYTVLRFYNAIAKEIKAWAISNDDVPDDVKLVIFSYYFTKAAPVKEVNGKYVPIDDSVVLSDNIVVRFADIVTNQYFSFADEHNAAFGYGEAYLDMWKPVIANCKVWYWGYTTNHTFYYFYLPTIQKIKTTLNVLKDIGAEYVLLQGNTTEDKDWKAVMDNYVYSKLLTDPDLDEYALRDEFISYYYGAGAEYIKEMVQSFDNAVKNLNEILTWKGCSHAYWAQIYRLYPNSHITGDKVEELLDTQFIMAKTCENALALIDGALDAVNASSVSDGEKAVLKERLELVKLTPLFTLCYYKEYLYGDNGFNTSYYSDNAAAYTRVKNEFFAICDRYGVEEYGERLKVFGTMNNSAETWFGGLN